MILTCTPELQRFVKTGWVVERTAAGTFSTVTILSAWTGSVLCQLAAGPHQWFPYRQLQLDIRMRNLGDPVVQGVVRWLAFVCGLADADPAVDVAWTRSPHHSHMLVLSCQIREVGGSVPQVVWFMPPGTAPLRMGGPDADQWQYVPGWTVESCAGTSVVELLAQAASHMLKVWEAGGRRPFRPAMPEATAAATRRQHVRSRPRIYVAGPFNPAPHVLAEDREAAIRMNVRAATAAGALVAANGGTPFVPHVLGEAVATVAHTLKWPGGEEDVWVPAGIDFLADSDGMVLLPGWERSRGSVAEREQAQAWKIPSHELARDAVLTATAQQGHDPALAAFIRALIPGTDVTA